MQDGQWAVAVAVGSKQRAAGSGQRAGRQRRVIVDSMRVADSATEWCPQTKARLIPLDSREDAHSAGLEEDYCVGGRRAESLAAPPLLLPTTKYQTFQQIAIATTIDAAVQYYCGGCQCYQSKSRCFLPAD